MDQDSREVKRVEVAQLIEGKWTVLGEAVVPEGESSGEYAQSLSESVKLEGSISFFVSSEQWSFGVTSLNFGPIKIRPCYSED